MSNFDSSLSECLGFSQIIMSEFLSVFIALEVMSSRLPIGVETMYRPFFITIILIFSILLHSCAPANNNFKKTIINEVNMHETKTTTKIEVAETRNKLTKSNQETKTSILFPDQNINSNITIILSKKDNPDIVNQIINVVELAVYQKKIKNISFKVKFYSDKKKLNDFLLNQDLRGKVFLGPLNSSDSEILEKFCSNGAIFFSFSSNTRLAKKCVFLVNFFPENELRTVFNFFPTDSKIALLYPENKYGFAINAIIDQIADQSNSIIVNRSSYKTDLSNASEAIKELGKYELRKYELNRQKKILASKKDEDSRKRLIKLEKFQTTRDFDFTHVLIADYGLRLLQVAPLLPYYDIDPNVVQFVGTGAWDDKVFFDEPSLNGSIYPGIEFDKRQKLNQEFQDLYEEKLLRTSTLPYDLVGLLEYLINNKYKIADFFQKFEKNNLKFSGVDGNFYFLNNKIERDLEVLEINHGSATVISK